MKKLSPLAKKLGEIYDKAHLPPDSLIRDPRKKYKVEGDGTFGIQGDKMRISKKEKAYHARLDANIKRSLKRKPKHVCSE